MSSDQSLPRDFFSLSPNIYKSVWQEKAVQSSVWRLLEGSQDGVVSSLGVEAGVEEQRVALGPPGVVVTDTPDGNADAVLLVDAGLNNVGPVGLLRVLDVNLGHGALGCGAAEKSHGVDGGSTLTGGQVSLRTDTVNGPSLGNPLLNVAGNGLCLCVRSSVQAAKVS